MQFELDEVTEAVRETARRFAEEKLAPHYQSREADGRFDRDLLLEMGALGLVAPDLPEQLRRHRRAGPDARRGD